MPIFPQIVTKNWQLKLAALAMAVMLWTVPRFDSQSRQVLEDIPVRIQLNDPQYALVGQPFPSTVQVTLSGPARAIFGLELDRPSVVVPVDRVVAADTAVLLRFQWLRVPEGEEILVEEFVPSSVRLTFEPLEVGAVALAPRFTGSLPQGLSLAQPPSVEPELVRVSGPASRLGTMDSVNLLPLDLSLVNRSGPFVQHVDTTGFGGMVVSPVEATVHVLVDETADRTFSDVRVSLPTLPSDPQLQVRTPTVNVILSGARSLVQAVDSASLTVTPRAGARELAPGEELRAELVVEGVPPLVEARLEPATVLIRRPSGR